MGTWNTIEMYPSSSQGGTCSNAFYELTADNKVNVVNSHIVGQELLTASAVAVLASDDGTAKLEVTFPSSPTRKFASFEFCMISIWIFFSKTLRSFTITIIMDHLSIILY